MNDTTLPNADSAAEMLQAAIAQIRFARKYTLQLLDETPQDLWFQMPDGLPTHIAWQVGHLAVSEYGLLMFRLRGRRPDDLKLIPGTFRKAYTRQSTPTGNCEKQMSPGELRERLAEVHSAALEELQQTDPAVLLEPVEMPYAGFPIKLGAILFCPLHEHTHAGQIGLLRRALGLTPVR